ncbi:hypothetical protein [Actinomadura geliboluensis]
MKTETLIAIVGLGTTLAGSLGSGWLAGHYALRLQRHKDTRDEQAAADIALEDLLVAAAEFQMSSHAYWTRWNDAASRWTKLTGARRAAEELRTDYGPSLQHLLRLGLRVSRWQEPGRQPIGRAASNLIDAAGDLSGALGDSTEHYQEATNAYNEALGAVRRAVDEWDSSQST